MVYSSLARTVSVYLVHSSMLAIWTLSSTCATEPFEPSTAGTGNVTNGSLDLVRENEPLKASRWECKLELDKNMVDSARVKELGAGCRIAIEVVNSLDLLMT